MVERIATGVAAGLLALSGCDTDSGSSPDASEPPADAEAAPAGASAEADEVPTAVQVPSPADPPAEPPPSGRAVVKVGALLFYGPTGEIGFELPPLGTDPGMTVNVLGMEQGRIAIETLTAVPPPRHCAGEAKGLRDFRLRLYVERDDLLPVTTRQVSKTFADGSSIGLMAGAVVLEDAVYADGATLKFDVPEDAVDRFYEPTTVLKASGELGTLRTGKDPLTLNGQTLAESGLYRVGNQVRYYDMVTKGDDVVLTVRNVCAEIEAVTTSARVLERAEGLLGDPALLGGELGGGFGGGLTGELRGGEYGSFGIGLSGTGPTPKRYHVEPGVAVTWGDGSTAGLVIAARTFTDPPREKPGRRCFDVAITASDTPTVELCFPHTKVEEVTPSLGTAGALGMLAPSEELHAGGGGASGYMGGLGATGTFGSRARSTPRVRQAKAKVAGSLDKDIIRRIVRAHINEVRYCYNQGLSRDPKLAGRVNIEFVIGATGKVTSAKVESHTMSDAKVGNCIAKAVKRWKFPRPPGGGVVKVAYPFVLSPH